MADSYTGRLRFRLQQTGANNNSWGGLLNSAALQLIDDAISGAATITVAGSDVTLSTANGASDQARNAMLVLQGAPGADRNIIIPSLTKEYVVLNLTGQIMTIQTAVAASASVAIAAGAAPVLLMCDGSNVYEVTPQAAGTATNALALGGISANQWARLNASQAFSKAQKFVPAELTMAASVTPDLDDGNIFTGQLTANTTIEEPDNIDVDNAQVFELVLSQASSGGPFTASFDAIYDFLGVTPAMPADPDAVLLVRCVSIPAIGKILCTVVEEASTTPTGITFDKNESSVDVFRRMGSPAGAVNVTVQIEAGVVISSLNPGVPAMDFSGGFASGSIINFINLGYVVGCGGDGGAGSVAVDGADQSPTYFSFGPNGRAGGVAIRAPGAGITFNVTNANGRIWGGGGGGGGGGARDNGNGSAGAGGGGGGGAGFGRGGGAAKIKENTNTEITATVGSDGVLNLNGTAAGGAAGAGASQGGATGAAGGAGGDYGAAGASGTTAVSGSLGSTGGAGGTAGKAIDLTGASPTWISGSGSPNVKGAVS